MISPLYTEYARYYDVIYHEYLVERVPRIIDFVEDVFKRDAERDVRDVLDIACGTGGPTIELARRGYRVLGLDISSEMIKIAREKARKNGVQVDFKLGDMRRLNFNEEFDAVTCFFSSLGYNLSDEDISNTLRGVYNSLRKGGVFIADVPNPLHRFDRWVKGTPVIWRVQSDNISILVIDVKWLTNTVTPILEWERTLIVKHNDKIDMLFDKHKLRLYTASELKLYSRITGFKKTKIYGDYNFIEDPKQAGRLILVAVK